MKNVYTNYYKNWLINIGITCIQTHFSSFQLMGIC